MTLKEQMSNDREVTTSGCTVMTVHGDYPLPDILRSLFMRLIIFSVAMVKSLSRLSVIVIVKSLSVFHHFTEHSSLEGNAYFTHFLI